LSLIQFPHSLNALSIIYLNPNRFHATLSTIETHRRRGLRLEHVNSPQPAIA
jgi:hypothetical protein